MRIKKLKRKDLSHHLSDECYLRKYKCKHCGHEDTYENITGIGRDGERSKYQRSHYDISYLCGRPHYDTCREFPLDCPNKCGAEAIKRKDMSTHRDECPLEPMACPFKEAGCETKLVRRDFEDHMSTLKQTQQHLLLTFQKMQALSKRCDELEKAQNQRKVKTSVRDCL